ncbi:MAG: hypothetical protein IJ946_09195 [Clostridia bacterium]|nr:hypothetical protein [Clostridia bacterium]
MKQPIRSKITLKELAFFGVYAALLVAFKQAMSILPNIEPVTVMLIALTCVYGVKALLPAYVFSVIQIAIYGFHIWNLMYLYVWAVLVFLVLLLLPIHKAFDKLTYASVLQTVLWTVLAALYGLFFGVICSVPYFITLGPAGAISWIAAGFAFDITHCISNAVITAVAFYPIYKALKITKEKLL